VFGDSVRPLFDAGVGDLVDSDVEIAPGVRLEATIGHTPGHHCVVIESAGERAVVTGDMVHHPVQLARPELSSSADWDPVRSAATRREAFARWQDATLVLGTHFAGPTAGWLRADGDGWRLDTVAGETLTP
jgi:glyoxylase-like metal-dependent hydrolase (beta-lactamase superfamily II)